MGDEDQQGRGIRVSLIGLGCGLGHAALHAWWTITGPPPFVRAESVFVAGWPLVRVAVLAALTCLGIGAGVIGRWSRALRWACCAIGWLAAAALAAYGLLLWPGLAQLLMVPFGEPFSGDRLGTLLLRALGTATAVLTVASTRPLIRGLRHGCPDCGRVHGRSPENRDQPTRGWAYAGAYLAIFGLVVRLAPVVPDWVRDGGLTAMLLGKTSGHPLETVEIVANVQWGLGLGIASASYASLTRPECTIGNRLAVMQ